MPGRPRLQLVVEQTPTQHQPRAYALGCATRLMRQMPPLHHPAVCRIPPAHHHPQHKKSISRLIMTAQPSSLPSLQQRCLQPPPSRPPAAAAHQHTHQGLQTPAQVFLLRLGLSTHTKQLLLRVLKQPTTQCSSAHCTMAGLRPVVGASSVLELAEMRMARRRGSGCSRRTSKGVAAGERQISMCSAVCWGAQRQQLPLQMAQQRRRPEVQQQLRVQQQCKLQLPSGAPPQQRRRPLYLLCTTTETALPTDTP